MHGTDGYWGAIVILESYIGKVKPDALFRESRDEAVVGWLDGRREVIFDLSRFVFRLAG